MKEVKYCPKCKMETRHTKYTNTKNERAVPSRCNRCEKQSYKHKYRG